MKPLLERAKDLGMALFCAVFAMVATGVVTDSFIFKADNTIRYQTIFINTRDPGGSDRRLLQTPYNPANSSEAWNNHFSAFQDQNLARIMLGYDSSSQVRVYNYADKNAAHAGG